MNNRSTYTGILHAVFALFILVFTTILGSLPILLMGLLKLIPYQPSKVACSKTVDRIATLWCHANNWYLDKLHPAKWHITGLNQLDPKHWYLVVANHQSWLDIVVLQRIFNRKIPVLKFFIKDQLKWVPFLGFSWWAMGCPFMKRYSAEYLTKNPHKKGQDIKATKKALTLFNATPSTMMSFVEGTRFNTEKKAQQESPYQYLLKPKAGGISFVIDAMNQRITHLLDVTIVYPNTPHSLWDFMCRRVPSIHIHVREIPIPSAFLTQPLLDNDILLSQFRTWLNDLWSEKDALITHIKQALPTPV